MPRFRRRTLLVDRRLQLVLALWLAVAAVAVSAVSGTLAYRVGLHLVEEQLYSPHLHHARFGSVLTPVMVQLNAAMGVGLILLAATCAGFYLRRAEGSLRRLLRHIGAIAEHGWFEPISFRASDPLHATAEEFNAMVGQLQAPFQHCGETLRWAAEEIAAQRSSAAPGALGLAELPERVRLQLQQARRELRQWERP